MISWQGGSVAFLIDGHNLIGEMMNISLSDPHDEEKLIKVLEEYHRETGIPIIVVFDPGKTPSPTRKIKGRGIKVLFAPSGSQADTLIKNLIRRSTYPKGLTVVSSDREIRRAARARRAKHMTTQRFARLLSASRKPKRSEPKIEEKEKGLSPLKVKEWIEIFRGGGKDREG